MFATVGVLDELEAVVDRVLGSDPAARSAAETEGDVLQLERVKAKLAALEARQCRLLRPRSSDISGSEQRTCRGALRRAVLGRDRQCTHEFCDKPADECQVDHFKPHSKGGPTTYEMGRGACAGHNRAKGAYDPTANTDDVHDP